MSPLRAGPPWLVLPVSVPTELKHLRHLLLTADPQPGLPWESALPWLHTPCTLCCCSAHGAWSCALLLKQIYRREKVNHHLRKRDHLSRNRQGQTKGNKINVNSTSHKPSVPELFLPVSLKAPYIWYIMDGVEKGSEGTPSRCHWERLDRKKGKDLDDKKLDPHTQAR